MRLPVAPRVDIAIAGAFVALTAAEAGFSPGVDSPVTHLLVAGLAMAVLAWRRSFPIGVAVWVVATNVAMNPENQFSTLLSLVLVSYRVGSETEPPRSYAGLAVVVLPFVAVSVAEGLEPSDVAAALVLLAGPWWVLPSPTRCSGSRWASTGRTCSGSPRPSCSPPTYGARAPGSPTSQPCSASSG